jgi:hypothetical protein
MRPCGFPFFADAAGKFLSFSMGVPAAAYAPSLSILRIAVVKILNKNRMAAIIRCTPAIKIEQIGRLCQIGATVRIGFHLDEIPVQQLELPRWGTRSLPLFVLVRMQFLAKAFHAFQGSSVL